MLDVGSGDGSKGRKIAKELKCEYYGIDPNFSHEKTFTGKANILLFRHVLHHVVNVRKFILEWIRKSNLLKEGFVYIRDHDVRSFREACIVNYHHTEYKHSWKNYSLELFDIQGLKELMRDLGLKFIFSSKRNETTYSYWIIFQYVGVSRDLPLNSCFNFSRTIVRMPYNFYVGADPELVKIHYFNCCIYVKGIKCDLNKVCDVYEIPTLHSSVWKGDDKGLYVWTKYCKQSNFVISRNILNSNVQKGNIFEFLKDRLNFPIDNFLTCSLWAISNLNNPEPMVVLDLLNKLRRPFIVLYPWAQQAKYMSNGEYKKGKFYQSFDTYKYCDWTIDSGIMTKFDNLVGLTIPQLLSHTSSGHRIDSGIPLVRLWIAIVPKFMFDIKFQTIIDAQTHGNKRPAQIIRNFFGTKQDYMYIYRKIAFRKYFNQLFIERKAFIMRGRFYDGYIIENGKKIRIAVSGHLLNLLTMDRMKWIDWKMWMDTIENNIAMINDKELRDEYLMKFNNEEIVEIPEKYPMVTWHSYYDYKLAVVTFILYSFLMNLKINLRVLVYITRRLNKILESYPIFKTIFPYFIKQRLAKQNIEVDTDWQ